MAKLLLCLLHMIATSYDSDDYSSGNSNSSDEAPRKKQKMASAKNKQVYDRFEMGGDSGSSGGDSDIESDDEDDAAYLEKKSACYDELKLKVILFSYILCLFVENKITYLLLLTCFFDR